MSRLGEELAKINEGIGGEPTGTSDAALEIKRIIKALDPDASTDGGMLENVVKIRELVEEGKGSGANLKTLTIVNNSSLLINLDRCIVDGDYNIKPVEPGETVTVQYVTPTSLDDNVVWDIIVGADGSIDAVVPDGIEFVTAFGPKSLNITNAAADGATVTFTSGVA